MLSYEAFYDRKEKEESYFMEHCNDCNMNTLHHRSKGHNGSDRWDETTCLRCDTETDEEYNEILEDYLEGDIIE